MAPLTPHWVRPSHPEIQEVLITSPTDFTTRSISRVSLPPYGLFAKLAFPPCTPADKATYATVQMGREEHLNLNSDLVYINHSCEPSLIFDTASLSVIAGANGLRVGEELSFFYPSTEWDMAQGFSCFCGAPTCRGQIHGAKNMSAKDLEGAWLNPHIRSLLEEQEQQQQVGLTNGAAAARDEVGDALRASVEQAKKMLEVAQKAMDKYAPVNGSDVKKDVGKARNGLGSREMSGEMGGDTRRGVTSRELSGEMGGISV